MGAGKTTAARRLANRLGWDFFHKYDEPLYRKLESEVLKSTESIENVVISTGGGTACYFDNMEWMNQHGLTIFMRISIEAVVNRLMNAKRKRPLAEGKSEEELTAFVSQHYASRIPFYEQARITAKSENLDLDDLLGQIRALGVDEGMEVQYKEAIKP